jgi:uncharacterized protein YaiE (UPF0345 family)
MKAFPSENNEYFDGRSFKQNGMDLRDYFAAKAMQGLLATISYEHSTGDITDMEIAERAYQIADAMMKEREQ